MGSWAPLGRSWALLGASWVPLEHLLGALGRLLGASWVPHAALEGSELDFGGFRKDLRGVLEDPGPLFLHVLLLLARLWEPLEYLGISGSHSRLNVKNMLKINSKITFL